jgi:hypothetical protein
MKVIKFLVGIIVPLVFIAGIGYVLYPEVKALLREPCSEPLVYTVATYDKRFKLSESEFNEALLDAATLWNTAAGKTVVQSGEGPLAVHMVFGEVQQTSLLGEVIDTEQGAYEAKRTQVENLKSEFTVAKRKYEMLVAEFERAQAAYEKQVNYWNARGGAPQAEYQALQNDQQELEEKQADVNEQVGVVNAFAGEINDRVDELNVLADKLNKKVNTYNAGAGEDFDQGEYISDEEGTRINIYEFTDQTELRRVLAHEFGHALGLDHTENPDSIMYSYNIGTKFVLSEEDVAELGRACALD